MEIIIQLIAGLVGGNAAGAGAKNLSLGTIGNSIAGAIGGIAGGQALGGMLEGVVGDAAGGGVGGIALTLVAGLVKNMMSKS